MHVAWSHVAPGGGDAYERLLEIFVLKADRIEHCTRSRAFVTVKDFT
jgi:hypothetical protein